MREIIVIVALLALLCGLMYSVWEATHTSISKK